MGDSLTNNPAAQGKDEAIEGALKAAEQALKLKDFYTVYLENYCAWDGDDQYSYCSPREAGFWFNPLEVWDLNGSSIDAVLPQELKVGLHSYKDASKAMYFLYIVAIGTTGLTLLVGISALFSRWGSFVTTFFAAAAALSTILASTVATIIFAAVIKVFNEQLKRYGIIAGWGMPLMRITWLAVLFSLAGAFFWLISICCCSGRSPYKTSNDSRRVRVEKTPYTYERVGSPYLGPKSDQAVPLEPLYTGTVQRENAYEPFRSQQE